MVMDVTVRRYGKPSKRFHWKTREGDKVGLSAERAQSALDHGRLLGR